MANLGDHMAVAKVLASIPQLEPADLVDAVIAEMGSAGLDVPYSAKRKVHFLNIALHCLASEQARGALVRAVEFFAAGLPQVEQIRRLAGLADSLLEPEDERRIEELLRRCEVGDLRALYQVVTEGKGAGCPVGLTTAWEMFEFLLDVNGRPGWLAPHLRFVALLRGRLVHQEPANDPELKDELGRWLYRQRDLLRELDDVAATELELLLRQPPPFQTRTDLPVCLVVEIDRSPVPDDGTDPHRVTHWTQADQSRWSPVRGEDVELPSARLGDYVVELVLKAEEEWTSGGPLLLEFMLAPDLVNLAVERWPRQISENLPPRALGQDYEVVLRSDARLRPRHRHRHWRDRWDRFMRGEGGTHVIPLDEAELGATHDDLMRGCHLVACVLSAPPDHPLGRAQLEAAIDAGLPIVLWCRDVASNVEFREIVHDVVQPVKLKKLPESILQLRSSAACESVALLWDDPDRPIPPVPHLRVAR